MSVSQKPNIEKFLAGETLTGKRGYYVKFGADKKHVVLCGNAEKAIGTLRIPASSECTVVAEDAVEVEMLGGGGLALAVTTIAAGDSISSDGNGKADVGASGEWCPSIAMSDAVAGDLFEVFHNGHYKA